MLPRVGSLGMEQRKWNRSDLVDLEVHSGAPEPHWWRLSRCTCATAFRWRENIHDIA
jgi:hypothetical protein